MGDENRIKIGCARLNNALRSQGKTAADMCRATGLTSSSVSRYLKGQSIPKVEPLSLMANYLGVNPAWLMGYDVPMTLNADYDIMTESEKLSFLIEHLTPKNREHLMNYVQFLIDNQKENEQ